MKGNGNLQTMSPRRADWKLQIAAVAPVHAHGRRCKPFWAIEVGQRVLDYHLLLRWAWAPPGHCNSHSNLWFSFWTPSKLKTAQSRASATIKHLPDDRFQGLTLQASFVTSWYINVFQCRSLHWKHVHNIAMCWKDLEKPSEICDATSFPEHVPAMVTSQIISCVRP